MLWSPFSSPTDLYPSRYDVSFPVTGSDSVALTRRRTNTFWAHFDPAGLGEHDVGSRWQPLASIWLTFLVLRGSWRKALRRVIWPFTRWLPWPACYTTLENTPHAFNRCTARAAAGVHTPSTVRSQRVNLACLTGKRLASGRFPSFARLRRVTRASWTRISLSLRPDTNEASDPRSNARSPKRSGAMHWRINRESQDARRQ